MEEIHDRAVWGRLDLAKRETETELDGKDLAKHGGKWRQVGWKKNRQSIGENPS